MKVILLFLFIISCSTSSKDVWHQGVDSNGNGVRDDIERWISQESNYSNEVKEGILKFAKIDPASCDYHHHLKCLENVTDKAFQIQITLLSMFNNSEQRQKAYRQRIKKCHANESSFLNFKCQ